MVLLSLTWTLHLTDPVQVCEEEVKNECISTRFCDISCLYCHKSDLRIAQDCTDFDLLGWGVFSWTQLVLRGFPLK